MLQLGIDQDIFGDPLITMATNIQLDFGLNFDATVGDQQTGLGYK